MYPTIVPRDDVSQEHECSSKIPGSQLETLLLEPPDESPGCRLCLTIVHRKRKKLMCDNSYSQPWTMPQEGPDGAQCPLDDGKLVSRRRQSVKGVPGTW